MRCPVDDAPLREVTRSGVKIDLCSECRGVWLDRGELDHLLEAASAADRADEAAPAAGRASTGVAERREEPRYDARSEPRSERRYDDDDDDDDRRRPKKKRSWLSEILEFGE